MDLVVPMNQTHDRFYSFHCVHKNHRLGWRIGARFCSNLIYVGHKDRFLVLYVDDGNGLSKQEGFRKQRRNWVFAVSRRVEAVSSKSQLSNSRKTQLGRGNSSQSFEEGLSNSHLRGLVRNGDLEEGFKHLVSMVYRGYIPDIITRTSLICGFC